MIKIFDKYEKWGAYHWNWIGRGSEHWYNKMVALNLNEFPPTGSVLDIGCGDGVTCKLLKDKGLEVTGFDSNEDAVNFAKSRVDGVKIELSSIEDITLNRNYDYFLAQDSIEHFENITPLVDLFIKHCDKFMIISTDITGYELGKYEYHNYSLEELVELFKPFKVDKLYQFRKVYGVKISK
ncbi:MAG: class I SAM-dependent methyltransferase [Candidatus Zambryskibacteria bacterium]|nr:class I SAM-dependent methyltransferase [Candidatus Zambryskibacteria bacterium]